MAKPLSLRYTRTALRDLEEFSRYLAKDSPERAKRWLENLQESLERLERFPESGARPKDDGLRRRGFRIVIVGEVLVFYIVAGRAVEVRRVVHGRRRYEFLI